MLSSRNPFLVAVLLLLAVVVVVVQSGMDMGGTKKEFIEFLSSAGALSAKQSTFLLQNFLIEDEDEATLTNERFNEAISMISDELRNYLLDEVESGDMDYSVGRYVASVFGIDFGVSSEVMRQASSDAALANYNGNGNVELLGRSDPDPVPPGTVFGVNSKKYNGIWGYAVGEREYALQCNSNGLHIIDITNAPNTFRVQFIPMPGGTTWRDVETYEAEDGVTYAYVAAQNQGNLWVVNLSYISGTIPHNQDENPIPKEGYVDRGRRNDGHTVSINNGLLFLNTAYPNKGCQIFDLKADPWDPPFIKQYGGLFDFGGTDLFAFKDCHDSIAKSNVNIQGSTKDILFAADGNSGRFRIVDLENVRERGGLEVIGETRAVGNSYAHFNVVTEDMKYLIGFDEFDTYDISIYDISDMSNPVFKRFLQYSQDDLASARVHNGQVRGDYLFVAYYEAGFRVFDISGLPDTITEVGKYETFRDPEGTASSLPTIRDTFDGGWNVYSYLPSGKVLHSDTRNGLFIFQVGPVAPSPPTAPSLVSTLPPVSLPTGEITTCKDFVSWSDQFGFDCAFYGRSGCVLAGLFDDENGVSANEACCACGGGVKDENTSSTPAPAPVSTSPPVSTAPISVAPISVAPTPAPGLPFCFSGSSLVQVEDKGLVSMKDLQVGDSILVDDGRYERIYSFGHLDRTRKASFLKLETTSSTIEISANHLLFVEGETNAIPAGQVKIGDNLIHVRGDKSMVTSIENVQRIGLYAPFTPSGNLIVNNLLASNFVALDESQMTVEIMGIHFNWHWLAHKFEFPHRLVCHYLSYCTSESYNEAGISNWVSASHKMSISVLQLSGFWFSILKNTILLFVVFVFSIFSVLEGVVGNFF